MSKTLHPFGRVLFDELEQIAVRRGGIASLKWLQENLEKTERCIEELSKKVAEPPVDCRSPRKTPDEWALQAGTRWRSRPSTVDAVDQLSQENYFRLVESPRRHRGRSNCFTSSGAVLRKDITPLISASGPLEAEDRTKRLP